MVPSAGGYWQFADNGYRDPAIGSSDKARDTSGVRGERLRAAAAVGTGATREFGSATATATGIDKPGGAGVDGEGRWAAC